MVGVRMIGAAVMVLGLAGCASGGMPSGDGLNPARMRDACRIGAAEELDVSQGQLVFAGQEAVRQSDGSYVMDGVADGQAFRCVFNEFGKYNSTVKR